MLSSVSLLLAQTSNTFNKPGYFETVVSALLLLGALAWLVASALGFSRVQGFGASARWFAVSAVCVVLYHIHLIFVALSAAIFANDPDMPLRIGAFFNIFILLGGICMIVGLTKMDGRNF
jgi:uncharacterized membrane protein YhdT